MSTRTPAGWQLESSYASELPSGFYSEVSPTAVAHPQLVILNDPLALDLGFDPKSLRAESPGAIFSGNAPAPGSRPIAQAYAGHQYGHFTRLGDGRALLLGEQIDLQGRRWDLHFKGSGPTPYSRRGDGRAALGPMLREFLISEAMHALRIPTTRSLAVTATGQPVFRETPLQGAVLTRVASSHIRVGTFEYASRFLGPEAVRALAEYSIRRHDPDLQNAPDRYADFLCRVISRQARLIARWMLVGFVHGVMNTDNMLISGETIDYGPCAFMDRYDPNTVFSSIDEYGRYAYSQQPLIGHWNLTRLAETLLPLLSTNPENAIERAKELLDTYSQEFSNAWLLGMGEKLGIHEADLSDSPLFESLLDSMRVNRLDWTQTFRALTDGELPTGLESWIPKWKTRLSRERADRVHERMRNSNPQIIPRNHRVEKALSLAAESGDFSEFNQILEAVRKPWSPISAHQGLHDPAPEGSKPYVTFCGT